MRYLLYTLLFCLPFQGIADTGKKNDLERSLPDRVGDAIEAHPLPAAGLGIVGLMAASIALNIRTQMYNRDYDRRNQVKAFCNGMYSNFGLGDDFRVPRLHHRENNYSDPLPHIERMRWGDIPKFAEFTKDEQGSMIDPVDIAQLVGGKNSVGVVYRNEKFHGSDISGGIVYTYNQLTRKLEIQHIAVDPSAKNRDEVLSGLLNHVVTSASKAPNIEELEGVWTIRRFFQGEAPVRFTAYVESQQVAELQALKNLGLQETGDYYRDGYRYIKLEGSMIPEADKPKAHTRTPVTQNYP